jgi:hypothetical protein
MEIQRGTSRNLKSAAFMSRIILSTYDNIGCLNLGYTMKNLPAVHDGNPEKPSVHLSQRSPAMLALQVHMSYSDQYQAEPVALHPKRINMVN